MRVAAPMLVPALIMTIFAAPAGAAATPWRAGATPLAPAGIAIAGQRVWVTDFDRDRVLIFTLDGTLVGAWGSSGEEAGRFHGPAGIAVDPAGAIVVADLGNHRIQTFTDAGEPRASWDAGGAGAAPCGIAVGADGRVLATDIDGGVVRSWTAAGTPLRTWSGVASPPLAEPWGIAVARDGIVWVADHGNDRVARFTADGEWLGSWGVAGIADGQMLGPMGIAIANDGTVLVTDRGGARVQRFDGSGRLIEVVRTAGNGVTPPLLAALSIDGATMLAADVANGIVVPLGGATAGAPPPAVTPTSFALVGITPLPSRGPVTLRWSVPARGTLSAGVYALDGRHVATLGPLRCGAGEQALGWSARTTAGTPAPPGVYFVRATLDSDGGATLTRDARVVLVR